MSIWIAVVAEVLDHDFPSLSLDWDPDKDKDSDQKIIELFYDMNTLSIEVAEEGQRVELCSCRAYVRSCQRSGIGEGFQAVDQNL